jgi:hypothetical protein
MTRVCKPAFVAAAMILAASGCASSSDCGSGRCGHDHRASACDHAQGVCNDSACTTLKDRDREKKSIVGKNQDAFFPPDHIKRTSTGWFDAAAAVGRATDGTLYPQHFDGEQLNSLGKDRLSSIVAGRAKNQRTSVYLDTTMMRDRTQDAGRQKSIESFLIARGLSADQFAIETGPNPDNWQPADRTIQAYNRTTGGNPAPAGQTINVENVNVAP